MSTTQNKPLYTIDKFAGMSDNGGIFYNEGFLPQKINGYPVFEETFRCSSVAEDTTTNFSDLGTVSSTASYYLDTTYTGFHLINTTGDIFTYNTTSIYNGIIHSANAANACVYADLEITKDGNLLYTLDNTLGIGYLGKVKTGSSTTKIIDTAGRDFSTLGITVGNAAKNKVTNLRTGIEYTVTAISTTSSTNDTLEFTASGVNDNQANDYFIAWVDDKWNFFTTSAFPHYTGQVTAVNFRRQINQYDIGSASTYYVLNGNYLAQLASDEATIDDNYRQLPTRYQGRAFAMNTSKMLISAEIDGKGRLLLWDGYNDGWNNVLEIDEVANCLVAYKSGWAVFFNNTIYYTDGYQITELSSAYPDDYPSDATYSITPRSFASMTVYNDRFYIANPTQNYSRMSTGILIYDQKYGWVFTPCQYGSRNQYGTTYIPTALLVWGSRIIVAGYKFINQFFNYGNYSSEYQNKSLMFFLQANQTFSISQVELNIANVLRRYLANSDAGKSAKTRIQVSVGSVSEGVFQYFQGTGDSTTSIAVNGTVFNGAKVGDEVLVLDGVCSGERTFITAISNQGTADEVWTVEALSAGIGASAINLKVIKVKKAEVKTIDSDKLNEPIKFTVSGHLGNKAIIELVIFGLGGDYVSFPISLNSINLY